MSYGKCRCAEGSRVGETVITTAIFGRVHPRRRPFQRDKRRDHLRSGCDRVSGLPGPLPVPRCEMTDRLLQKGEIESTWR